MQIAKLLTADKVLTVKAHYAKRDGKPMPDNLYRWDFKTISGILERPEYTGCTVNFKTYCYRCARYKSNTGDCTMHYIREETPKLFVLRRIFDVTAVFIDNADDFRRVVQKQRFEEKEKAVKRRKKELEQAKKRITELDRIFKHIYEDDITGAISRERFLKLSAEYEAEQMELTPAIVNEFVKKIIVHAPDKSNGHRRQKIQIVWNFIGELEQDNETQTVERQRKNRTA